MNFDLMNLILPAVTAIAGSLVTLFISKGENEKDIALNHRSQLSEDEKAFRTELRDIVTSYKAELEESRMEIKELREEVVRLHKVNVDLVIENRSLHMKMDEMSQELKQLKDKK